MSRRCLTGRRIGLRLRVNPWQEIEKTCHEIKGKQRESIDPATGNMGKGSKKQEMTEWNPTKDKKKQ
jgi:hypothetical protein